MLLLSRLLFVAFSILALSACGGQPTEDTDSSSTTPGLVLSPANPSLTASATQTFTASGGTPPYTYSVISGGGSIDSATGAFTASASTSTVVIGATDSKGATGKTTAMVFGAVTILPANLTLGTNAVQPFTAAGGKAPYSFSKVSGVGAITSAGVFTAGSTPGSAQVKVTDSLGQSSTGNVTVNLALSISPATAKVKQGGTASFSGGGGTPPYTFSIVSGGGAIVAGTGAFTAPAQAGTVTVKVADSTGASATATVTVVGAVAITPTTHTLAVNNTKNFAASGGSNPYTFSIASGGGTIDSSTGAYTAPMSAGTASIIVTDSLGQIAAATVTINPALQISPAIATVASGGSANFTASGGVGPYAYSLVSGGGSINSASGSFTAPATAGTVTVKVTDALANTATATVTVLPPVTIAPATKTLAVNGASTFTANGGQPPYTFAVFSGGGSIDSASGAYTAPSSAGSAVVRVTDSLGGHADAAVTINPALSLSPATATLAYTGTKTFSATGGVGPYTYSITSGGGSVDASTGTYLAGTSAGTATVQAADSLGNAATATVTVVDPVLLTPAAVTLPPGGAQTFAASGGQTPYSFSIVNGGGSVNSGTGAFTAPLTAGTVTLKVIDGIGQSATATVTVVSNLAVSPATFTLAVGNTKTFAASGGVGPYLFSVQSGGGSIVGATGAYTAPASAGNAVILVTDAAGLTATANVTVNPALTLSPATSTLAQNSTATFTAAGGVSPYTYSVVSGGGTINPSTGAFTAPAISGTVTIKVTDALSNSATAAVTIATPVSITPTAATLAVNNTKTFGASGGEAPYSFAVLSGGGTIDAASGAYTAPAASGSAVVRVTDSLGQTADANITINGAISISPTTATLVYSATKSFSASGGVMPYTYSVSAGGGAIDAATGVYTAGTSAGTATVQVSDAAGNTATATVTIVAPVTISPAAVSLATGGTKTFSASGGETPYVFSVQSGSGTINAASGAYTAPTAAGSAVVLVTDALGQTATANVTIVPDLAISPATISLATNGTKTFSATGGQAPYTYSVSGGGSIDASSGALTAPATAGTVTVTVTDALASTANATVTVVAPVSITPAAATLAVLNSKTFSASGGLAPYTFSVQSGGGAIGASSGLYTAGATAGNAVLRVTDSLGQTADAAVTVNAALSISPASVTLGYSGTQSFSATGGVSPYSYAVTAGGGAIGSTTGSYTAGTSAGTATIQVSDAAGNISSATVTIVTPLSASPAAATLAAGAAKTFGASGGQTPYTYSVQSGGGTINSATGAYTAPAAAGSAVILVTDAAGQTATSAVTIVPVLSISPAGFTLAVTNTKTFTAGGGQTPYAYSVESGGGAIDPVSGAFTAPASAGSVVVKVADASGQSATATVTVNPALTISPTPTSVGVNGTKTFTASGGVSPYTFAVQTGAGSVDISGVYTAPASAGTATVRATDALGNTADAAVTITSAVVISPTTVTLAVNNTNAFSASGGQPPYTFARVSGQGSINSSSGVYTAPNNPGTTTVKVTDALNQSATATITINAALTIAPVASSVWTTTTKQLTASGGVSPYTYSVTSGTGTISANGLFTAPAGAEQDTIQVTDSFGNTATATIDVYLPLSISPDPGYVLSGNVLTFSAVGGDENYTFSVINGVGAIDPATGDYQAPETPGTATVKVADGSGSTAQTTVTTYNPLTMTPTAVTVGPGNTMTFTAAGGIAPLTFSMVSGAGSVDPATGVYIAPAVAGTDVVQVTDAIGNTDTSTVTVTAALSISPTTFKMGPAESKTFTASNGVPPITFSIESGGGSINASTGVFTSPTTPATVSIAATDSLGNVATATVTVVAPARVFTGGASACVIYSDGSIRCWGANTYGQLGTGNTTSYGSGANQMGINLPWINIGTGRTVKSVAMGLYHACAILDDNKVKCWGRNNYGQLGIGSTATKGTTTSTMGDSLAYAPLGTGRTAKKIFAGLYHTCAILDNDTLKCWGYNAYGQLGQGNTTNYGSAANQMGDSLPAIYLGSGRTVSSVAMGQFHTCALLDNATVKCFGRSNYGQLGYGNTNSVGSSSGQMSMLAAVNVGTGRTVKAITAGIYHTCAIRDDNKTVCWGRNNTYQLGIGSTTRSWGDSSGEMGDNLPLVNLGSGRSAVNLSSKYTHTCAQLDNNTLKCWGANSSGQLGVGSTTTMGGSSGTMGDNLISVNLGSGFTLSTMCTSTANSCALSTGYQVKCWGSATSGALGNGTTSGSKGTSSSQMGDNLPYVEL